MHALLFKARVDPIACLLRKLTSVAFVLRSPGEYITRNQKQGYLYGPPQKKIKIKNTNVPVDSSSPSARHASGLETDRTTRLGAPAAPPTPLSFPAQSAGSPARSAPPCTPRRTTTNTQEVFMVQHTVGKPLRSIYKCD